MTLTEGRIEKLLEDKWVLEFDKESEIEVLRKIGDIVVEEGTFWDIGAHAGLYSIICAKLYPNLSVYAFEPSKFTREEILRENTDEIDNVTVVPYPLSNETGTVTFLDSGKGDTRNALQTASNSPEDPKEVELKAYTGTSAIDELGIFSPDVVKIDVEGAEYRVLQGFDETILSNLTAVLCELHHIGSEDTDTVPYLREHGFEVEQLAERETYNDHLQEYVRQEHVLATPTD